MGGREVIKFLPSSSQHVQDQANQDESIAVHNKEGMGRALQEGNAAVHKSKNMSCASAQA